MPIFYDILQQLKIDENADATATMETRVHRLEVELARTKRLLREVVSVLEAQTNRDINGDGRIG